jgi:hypothetical protein
MNHPEMACFDTFDPRLRAVLRQSHRNWRPTSILAAMADEGLSVERMIDQILAEDRDRA